MRLKLSLLAVILLAAAIGIPYYLDSQIHRATAVVQIHPNALISRPDHSAGQGTTAPESPALIGR